MMLEWDVVVVLLQSMNSLATPEAVLSRISSPILPIFRQSTFSIIASRFHHVDADNRIHM